MRHCPQPHYNGRQVAKAMVLLFVLFSTVTSTIYDITATAQARIHTTANRSQSNDTQFANAVTGYRLPWPNGQAWQVSGVRTAHTPQPPNSTPRQAIDFGVPLYTEVRAMKAGDIVLSTNIGGDTNGYVVIDHNDGYCSAYVHLHTLSHGEVSGQRVAVQQGTKIGTSGRLGTKGAIHLHVAVYRRSGASCGGYSDTDKNHEQVIIFDEVGRELNYNDYPVSENSLPAEADPSKWVFIDVRPGAGAFWAVKEIEALYHNGITKGCDSSGTPYQNLPYCPDELLNRGQAAVLMLRLKYGSDYDPHSRAYQGYFVDVPAAHSLSRWIEKLYEDGITTGVTTTNSVCPGSGRRFCPDTATTRGTMALFLARTLNWNQAFTPGQVFQDVSGDNELTKAVEYMWWKGFTNGSSACVSHQAGIWYCPDEPIQRTHAAVVIARAQAYVDVTARCAGLTLASAPANVGRVTTNLTPDCPIDSSKYRYDSLIQLETSINVRSAKETSQGYRFSHWSDDLSGSDTTNSIAVGDHQKLVTAHFILDKPPTSEKVYLPLVTR